MTKWIVDIKGRAKATFEISVLREDFTHGQLSYGWFGPNKLLVSSSGGPCGYTLHPVIWNKMVKLAHEAADELNSAELEEDK